MVAVNLDESPADDSQMVAEDRRLSMMFHYWHARHQDSVPLDSQGPVILRPPVWYRSLSGPLMDTLQPWPDVPGE